MDCPRDSDFEQWKDVPGLEGRYLVSSLGRVWAMKSTTSSAKIRKLTFDKGYRRFGWYDRGRKKVVSELIHVTVAKAFLGKRPEGLMITHLDGDSLNNCADNLAYRTQAENIQDSVRHGTHVEARKQRCPQGHAYANKRKLDGKRWCKHCDKLRQQAKRQK